MLAEKNGIGDLKTTGRVHQRAHRLNFDLAPDMYFKKIEHQAVAILASPAITCKLKTNRSHHLLAFNCECCMQRDTHGPKETLLMDFFETQERYRRREMRGWMTLFVRILVIAGALWLGWLWGHAEQTSLQAEAELAIYENNLKINELSNENQALQRALAALRAEKTAGFVSGDNRDALRRVIARQIANGVRQEQIIQSIQSLGDPVNCRVVEQRDVAVATPLYAGPESNLSLFNGGLNLFIEGSAGQQAQRDAPWFDPGAPIKIRQVFLNGQKTVSGTLPIETIIPAEGWVLKLRYEKADLQGYVTATVLNCPVR